ncbi:hypothetical protein GCM10009775_30170 [Microbacterium aoyamense]|uniref:Maleylpyruvate isomerase n=1 Tax=Microbacterium aoyamense TaxID=344166 RepID=A0ABN2PZH0_9MICO|nr:hypothetical protein [Microbacterium aoyamense]
MPSVLAAPPTDRMLQARRGTAYFSRILGELSDDELTGEREAAIVARVALHARASAETLEALREGWPYSPHATPFDDESVRFTSTLNAHALRNLHAHAVVHLNVEWRDLPDTMWDASVTLWDGRTSTPASLVEDRRRLVWTAAISLDPLARISAVPLDLRTDDDRLPVTSTP